MDKQEIGYALFLLLVVCILIALTASCVQLAWFLHLLGGGVWYMVTEAVVWAVAFWLACQVYPVGKAFIAAARGYDNEWEGF